VVDFVEAFGRVTKDSVAGRAGSPLHLRDWQKLLLEHLFAWDEDGFAEPYQPGWDAPEERQVCAWCALGLYSLILGPKGAECTASPPRKNRPGSSFKTQSEQWRQARTLCNNKVVS
jgi:hypothetical protein